MTEYLFHSSDNPNIALFEPRPVTNVNLGLDGKAVFAISERMLPNYLLPRDCPRVTFYALPESKREDVERLLGASRHVAAIESGWLERVVNGRIHIYTLPADTFSVWDEGAGYYISRQPVTPLAMRTVDNMLLELAEHDVEIRILPSLWPLYDAVVNSSLQFSIIRMRNAQPR
ncbi:MAG: hypothetical protein GY803_26460 [Chloroflexi bacterium]|nr:hypothetical protein [Chloroflexota bacterium]